VEGGLLTPVFVACSTNAGVRTSIASDKHWGEKVSTPGLPPGLLTPVFVTCSTNAGVRRPEWRPGVRRPGYKARQCLHLSYPHSGMLMSQIRFIHCNHEKLMDFHQAFSVASD